MFAQSVLSRTVLAAAAGVLLTTSAAGAAAADDDPGHGHGRGHRRPAAVSPGGGRTDPAPGAAHTGPTTADSGPVAGSGRVDTASGAGHSGARPGSGPRRPDADRTQHGGRQDGGTPHGSRPAQPGADRGEDFPGDAADPTWRPHDHLYQGRVTSRAGLLVRSAPYRHSSAIGRLAPGQLLWVKCRMKGETVRGNAYWYKLADGRWTWASARYIATAGQPPRACR